MSDDDPGGEEGGAGTGRARLAVLDVGAGGANAAVLDELGRVLAVAETDLGGAALDRMLARGLMADPQAATPGPRPAAVGRARRLREAASLHPAAWPDDPAALRSARQHVYGAAAHLLVTLLTAATRGEARWYDPPASDRPVPDRPALNLTAPDLTAPNRAASGRAAADPVVSHPPVSDPAASDPLAAGPPVSDPAGGWPVVDPTGRQPRIPVVLVGGLARDPALAETVDTRLAGWAVEVQVAARPEAAAALGALAVPPPQRWTRPGPTGAECEAPANGPPGTAPVSGDPVGDAPVRDGPARGAPEDGAPEDGGPEGGATAAVAAAGGGSAGGGPTTTGHGVPDRAAPADPAPPPRFLPRPPDVPLRRGRAAVLVVAAVALSTAVVALLTGWLGGDRPPPAPAAGELVQYGYRFELPHGWTHTGGLPERRRSLLTPVTAPEGSDLIVVERSPLGYDTAAEPRRAAAELRAVYDAAVAGGSPLDEYLPADQGGPVGERSVVTYREQAGEQIVHWYVVLDGPDQLSVGCRATPTGADSVAAACARVVASIRRG